jgi:TPR repeat protein
MNTSILPSFSLYSCDQSETIEYTLKSKLYLELNTMARDGHAWLRLTGLGVGALAGTMTIVKRISLIAENAFKGAANILGSPFFDQCSFSRGLNQLIVQTIKNVVILPFSLISASFDVIRATWGMFVDPTEYTKTRFFEHNPAAENAYNTHRQQTELEARINVFNMAVETYKSYPQNVQALKTIAKNLEDGSIICKDIPQAMFYYTQAANLGDVESMLYLGQYYNNLQEPDYVTAFAWFTKAAEKNDRDATTFLGLSYYSGTGTAKNYDEAFKLFQKSANSGCPLAMLFLGIAYAKGHGTGITGIDYSKAAEWFRKGKALGDKQCETYLIVLLHYRPKLAKYNGEGLFPDELKWEGIYEAMKTLGIPAVDTLDIPNEEKS